MENANQKKFAEIQEYLQKHNIQSILDELLNELVDQKPDDPLKVLGQMLIAKSESTKENQEDLGPTKRKPIVGEIRGGFTVKGTRKMYENPWIHIREDQVIRADGNPGIYGVVTMKNWALGVVPLFPDGTVLLVGQHRYPHNEYSWEIPEGGGKIGVDALEEIKRELREEAGLTANKWTSLGPLTTSNSVVDETGYLWLAEDLVEGKMDPDGDEVLSHRRISIQQAIREIQCGKITDGLTVIGLYRAYQYLHTREKKYAWPVFDVGAVLPYTQALSINEGPVKRILNFWFGCDPLQVSSYKSFWMDKYSEWDPTIKERFESDWKMLVNKLYDNWDDSAESLLAKILLSSVFPRRMFKESSASFSTDHVGLAACTKMLDKGLDKKLHIYQRIFVLSPLMYSESVDHQRKSVQLFDALFKECTPDLQRKIDLHLKSAKEKLPIIEKFGRFPHRNSIMKRENTPKEEEEEEALDKPSFCF